MKQTIFTFQWLCTTWFVQFNYSDTLGSLWQFERDEPPVNNVVLNVNNGVFNSELFKYKATLVGYTANAVTNTSSSVKDTPNVFSIQVFN